MRHDNCSLLSNQNTNRFLEPRYVIWRQKTLPSKQTNKKQQRKNIITTKRHERGGYSHVCNAETIVSGDVVFEDGGVIRNAAVDELRQ